jgi:PleD family two-component response regulator
MNESSKYVTVSIGLANTVPDDTNSQIQLLDEADKSLYLAKQSGRNRVVIGQESMANQVIYDDNILIKEVVFEY